MCNLSPSACPVIFSMELKLSEILCENMQHRSLKNENRHNLLTLVYVAKFKERKEEVGVGVTEARSIY